MSRQKFAVVTSVDDRESGSRSSATANTGERRGVGSGIATAALPRTGAQAPLPPELAADLRRFLAAALVQDDLQQNNTVSNSLGERPGRDSNPC